MSGCVRCGSQKKKKSKETKKKTTHCKQHSGRIRVQNNNMQFKAAVIIQFHEKYNFIETKNIHHPNHPMLCIFLFFKLINMHTNIHAHTVKQSYTYI